MPVTNGDAVVRASDMNEVVRSRSDGLAQYHAAQARFYIASVYDLGLLEQPSSTS